MTTPRKPWSSKVIDPSTSLLTQTCLMEISVIQYSIVPRIYLISNFWLCPDSGTAGVRGAELLFNITNLQQATIGAVNGIARGGGNEFLIALDMRFATKDLAKFAQIEVGVGVVPGYGGTQYLSKLIGRGLALEYLLSSNDVKAEEAERIGWINKAFDTLEDMDNYGKPLYFLQSFLNHS